LSLGRVEPICEEGRFDGFEEAGFFDGHAAVAADEFSQRVDDLIAVGAGGKCFGEVLGDFAIGGDGVGVLADAGDGGVEFAIALEFCCEAHGAEEAFDAGVFGACEVAVGIHAEDESVENRAALGFLEMFEVHD
jgi:hypothetical protein